LALAILSAQDMHRGGTSWMLPNAKIVHDDAVRLLTNYALVSLARALTASVERRSHATVKHVVSLATTLAVLHYDAFVLGTACMLVSEIRDAAVSFRAFARLASDFPHYETHAYAASRFLAIVTFYAFQVAPAVAAAYALGEHAKTGAIAFSSPVGIFAVAAVSIKLANAGRAYVAEAQHAVAERTIRDRILRVATSAEV